MRQAGHLVHSPQLGVDLHGQVGAVLVVLALLLVQVFCGQALAGNAQGAVGHPLHLIIVRACTGSVKGLLLRCGMRRAVDCMPTAGSVSRHWGPKLTNQATSHLCSAPASNAVGRQSGKAAADACRQQACRTCCYGRLCNDVLCTSRRMPCTGTTASHQGWEHGGSPQTATQHECAAPQPRTGSTGPVCARHGQWCCPSDDSLTSCNPNTAVA